MYQFDDQTFEGFNRKLHIQKDPFAQYCATKSLRLNTIQEKLMQATKERKDCVMLSSADQMQFICNILKSMGAKKTIDVGVYTGFSSLCVAMVLPADGKVVACDIDDTLVSVGKPFWKEAGVEQKIDLRLAPAAQTMQSLLDNGEGGTYDYIFIDADKGNYDIYYELGLKLVRTGGLICIDNVWWFGQVNDPSKQDPATKSIRALNDKLHKDDRIDITMLPISDGVTLAWKR